MKHKGITDVSTAARGAGSSGHSRSQVVPCLTVASHPMPRRAGERLLLHALATGRPVELSRNAPELVRPGSSLGAPLVDPFISRKPIRITAGPQGSIEIDPGEGTTVAVQGEPIRRAVRLSAEEIASGVAIELGARVTLCLHLAVVGDPAPDPLGMVGESSALDEVRRSIQHVVDLDVPVLIRGETGTGKELVARAIHERSPRKDGPFVAVNLGAIPRDLAAAELFGAQRGAYTGATREREGFFRAADGGTLFLDEVGEASADVQVLLLRVLETGKLYPVGGSTPVAVDVRVLAATDSDLEARIQQGVFKAPLLHRLAGFDIRLAPLRERREDIGRLFHHFALAELSKLGEEHRLTPDDPYVEPWLPSPLASRLLRYAWPGNIRQLRNVTRQLVIGSRGKPCLQVDLPVVREIDQALEAPRQPSLSIARAPQAESAQADSHPMEATARRRKSTDLTEEELLTALRASGWDVKAAAARLGVARSSVYDLIDRCQSLRTAGDLSADEITACFRECDGDLDRMVQRLEVSRRALNRRVKELGLA
ncbi:MAG: sigma-54 dependent transcriptional regulator [Polyangiaceae bacterium]